MIKQVQLHDRMDRWVFHCRSDNRPDVLRRVCVLDKGWVLWGIPISDTYPGGQPALEQPTSMIAVKQGVIMVGAGIIPHRRTTITSGTCLQLSETEMKEVNNAAMLHYFGDNTPTKIWAARDGNRWLTTAQNGDTVWGFSLTSNNANTDTDHDVVNLDGVGQVRLWAGVRPARVPALNLIGEVDRSNELKQTLQAAASRFFFG